MSRAAAPHFKFQASGAYVHMTSTSGLIGNFGQANYSAAKLGIVGLSKSIALDMQRFNVRSNAVAPFAWTRMIDSIPTNTPEQQKRVEGLKKLVPEKIAPFVIALLSATPAQSVTGQIFGVRNNEIYPLLAAAPHPHRAYVGRLDAGNDRRARLPDVRERFLSAAPLWRCLHLGPRLTMPLRPDLLLAHELRAETRQRYERRDAILYALGLGLGADRIDPADLPFLLEDRLALLPTFARDPGSPGMWIRGAGVRRRFRQAGSLRTGRRRFTHPCRPRPRSCAARASLSCDWIAAKAEARSSCWSAQSAIQHRTLYCTLRQTLLLRGDGGFGGSPPPQQAA